MCRERGRRRVKKKRERRKCGIKKKDDEECLTGQGVNETDEGTK